MRRILLRAKLDGARVTRLEPDYEGSLTLDPRFLEAAGIVPFEQVHVLNRENGSRLETYAIPGRRGSREVCLNGPAARAGLAGDRIVVLVYGQFEEAEMAGHHPRIVRLEPGNRLSRGPRKRR